MVENEGEMRLTKSILQLRQPSARRLDEGCLEEGRDLGGELFLGGECCDGAVL